MLWVNSFLSATLLNGLMFFFDLGMLTSMSWLFLPHSLSSSPPNLTPLSSLMKDRPNSLRMGFGLLILLLDVRKSELDLFDACLWVTAQEGLQFCLVRFFSLAHLISFPSTSIWWWFFLFVCFFAFAFVCFGSGVCVCLFVEPERSTHGCQSVKMLPQILRDDRVTWL